MKYRCEETGHSFYHAPLRVTPEGHHFWECRYCEQLVKTPDSVSPHRLEKVLVKEIEAHLRKEAEG